MPKRKRSKSPNLDLIEDGFDDEFSNTDDNPGTPIQRNAANARERARMRVLSKAFFNLKRNIPWVPADTKLSKLDTLRLAKNYISYLAATLDGQSVESFSTNLAQPAKTSWPFIFQPVQTHEPAKVRQLPDKSQHSVASSTTAASATIRGDCGGARPFSAEKSNFDEPRPSGLNHPHPHHHHHHLPMHHVQQREHYHSMAAAASPDVTDQLHSFSNQLHHLAKSASGN